MAFKRIVKSPAPDGQPWWPIKIFDAMWELWDDRPKEIGYKYTYFKKYEQRIGRLKNGVTLGRVRSVFFFTLIEKFVQKYSSPGEFTLTAEDISIIHKFAKTFYEFSHPELSDYKGFIRGSFEREIVGSTQDEDEDEESIVLLELSQEEPLTDKIKNKSRILPNRYLAIKIMHKSFIWPSIYFSSMHARLELGFFMAHSLNIALFRSTLAGISSEIHGMKYDREPGVITEVGLHQKGFTILDFRNDFNKKTLIVEKNKMNGLAPGSLDFLKFRFSIVDNPALHSFSKKVIRNFDNFE